MTSRRRRDPMGVLSTVEECVGDQGYEVTTWQPMESYVDDLRSEGRTTAQIRAHLADLATARPASGCWVGTADEATPQAEVYCRAGRASRAARSGAFRFTDPSLGG